MSVTVIERDGYANIYPDATKWVVDDDGFLHVIQTTPHPTAGPFGQPNTQPTNENLAAYAPSAWASVHKTEAIASE